jgi:thymidylate kinase
LKVLYYRKKGIVVISDRYIYDLINFYGARGLVKSLVKNFSQKPTKCFYVKVSPKILKKRNDELNIDAIKKVTTRIEKNRKYFGLIEIENENFELSEKILRIHLSEVLKNV